MSNTSPLMVHLCTIEPGDTSWSATVAIEGPLDWAGRRVALFYQGLRLEEGELDEWGYRLFTLETLSAPYDLRSEVYFEARALSPAVTSRSILFHPPLVHSSILTHLETHRVWPKHLPLKGVRLRGASLGQADLRGVDLTDADLTGAKLWRTNLEGAILKGVTLAEANLDETNFENADLENTKVHGANLSTAHLNGADIRGMRGLSLGDLVRISDVVRLDDRQLRALEIAKNREQGRAEENDTLRPSDTFHSKKSVATTMNQPSTLGAGGSYYKNNMPQSSRVRPPQPKEISESTKVSQIMPPLMMSAQEKTKEAERQRKRSESYKKYAQNRSLRGGIEFHLNLVPAGSFIMGRDEGDDVMRPRHPVKISRPYFIGVTQVTQKLFERVMQERRGKFSGEDRPVDSVSWNDAIDFCNRLSAVEGLDQAYRIGPKGLSWNQSSNGYRLPTEAEWEYAAYAGVPFLFAGSDDLNEVGWYRENSDQETHDVMQKKPNPWGLYDFSGNVWEWCYDLFKEDAYHSRGVEDTVDPVVDGEGPKVIKGGSWSYEAEGLEVSYRSRLATHFKTSRIGFRIARTPKLKKV